MDIFEAVVCIQGAARAYLITDDRSDLLIVQTAFPVQKSIQITAPAHTETFKQLHKPVLNQQVKESLFFQKRDGSLFGIEDIFLARRLLAAADMQRTARGQRQRIDLQVILFSQKLTPSIIGLE